MDGPSGTGQQTFRRSDFLYIQYGSGPAEGIPTLTEWWGLCGQMIPRAVLAVAYATGRASHARQVKGDDPDQKGYSGPPGWGLGVRLTTSHHKKKLLRNLKRRPRPTRGCRADGDDKDDSGDYGSGLKKN